MSELKDLMAIFKAETEEHLTRLEKGLIELERRPEDLDLLKDLSREVHTLKGAARAFGFSEIQDIAHRIEDIFEAIREKKISFDSHRAEQIFKGLDAIRILLEGLLSGEKVSANFSGICKALETSLSKEEDSRRLKPEPDPALSLTQENVPPLGLKEEYLRIPLSRVDELLYLVGEVVIQRMNSPAKILQAKRISKLTKEAQKAISNLGESIKKELVGRDGELIKGVSQCDAMMERLREQTQKLYDLVSSEAFQLDPIIEELQSKIKRVKMLPLSTLFDRFPRMVRDIAFQQGKEVRLEISGEETELDKKVLERIKSSLIHLLRNSIDHGIEDPEERKKQGKPTQGTIKISAFNEGDNVVISVEDDGKGIDLEEVKQNALKRGLVSERDLLRMTDQDILNLIFLSGYSTSQKVTELSGRGLGLDIVLREVSELKGRVMVNTQRHKGTTFRLILPLSIAIIQVLFVKVKGMVFAFPIPSVNECLRVDQKEISTIEGRMAFSLRGHIIPLLSLSNVLGIRSSIDEGKKNPLLWVVLVGDSQRQIGFIVDEIVGEEEVFIKSLGRFLGKVKYVSGAVIMSNGEVIVVLDVEDLLKHSPLSLPISKIQGELVNPSRKKGRILVVEDAFSTRELERSILENKGYWVDTAVDGLDALNRLAMESYDLILSDIEMPRMDGFELCRALKSNEAYKRIPVVMLTAMQKEEDKRRGMEVGAAAYLVKSHFDQANLLEIIERLIG